ncbi:hypothetical protein [Fluviicola chungangensis]|uniref:Uncharacterized protein n=1 Tax=Fluviicola chungangensis TaxID=2597671 RepID=A0A556MN13_9FLAO|nr:hypothetical protein [Fluviicola chungangensis]TSJ41327.1 hypothetical protein FO442_15560 [Fluviicola chungangensis]
MKIAATFRWNDRKHVIVKHGFIKKAIALLVLPFLLFSCEKENSEDVNQDKIYTDYELFYNKNEDKTYVVARFKFGGPTGTNLELTNGASVKFNGDLLTYNAFYVGHYKEYAGKISSGTFVYSDVDGNQFTNTTPAMDTVAFQPGFDTIVKSQANTLTWIGNSLAANQSVGVFVGSWTWGQDALFYQNQSGATNIVMGITGLSSLALGTSTVYMDRANETTVAQGTSEGGKIRSKYRALNKVVQVVP